jgi:CSLREA domain-containing protein
MRTTIFSSVPYKFLTSLAIIAMVLAALPVMPAYAASITVTNTTDDLTDGNGCSLREAIINANNNGNTYPDCIGGSGADVITLASGSIHTLSLTDVISTPQAGDLDITDAAGLTIQASGATAATIDGGDIDRVLDVATGAGA